MLQVIQLDLPNVGTGDIRASAGMPFKLVLDYLGLLKAILLTRIRHQVLYLQDLSIYCFCFGISYLGIFLYLIHSSSDLSSHVTKHQDFDLKFA